MCVPKNHRKWGPGEAPGTPRTVTSLSVMSSPYGPVSGQCMVAMKEACRASAVSQGCRVYEPVLAVDIACSSEGTPVTSPTAAGITAPSKSEPRPT